MKKHISALVLALALPAAALAQLPAKESAKAKAAAKDGPVAVVNGVAIPRYRSDMIMQQQERRGAKDSEQIRAQIRDLLINNELLAQEGARSGLAKKQDVQRQIELTRQEVIANAVVDDYLRTHPVSDAEVQKAYDSAKAQTGDKEYKVSHILLGNEADAKAVIAELKKGAKFEDLAQKRSLDEGTRPNGGDLDWTLPSNLDKAFADAMMKLEKGKITETPVRTRYGYHVIRLDDVRQVNFPPLEQVKQQLHQRLVAQRIDTLLHDLRAKAKIE